jgi:hypothetical protein
MAGFVIVGCLEVDMNVTAHRSEDTVVFVRPETNQHRISVMRFKRNLYLLMSSHSWWRIRLGVNNVEVEQPWSSTAALSAPFILANSAAGLAGAYYAGQMPAQDTWLYAIAALLGAVAGAAIGLRWMSQAATRYALAAILATAGVQLLML